MIIYKGKCLVYNSKTTSSSDEGRGQKYGIFRASSLNYRPCPLKDAVTVTIALRFCTSSEYYLIRSNSSRSIDMHEYMNPKNKD